MNDLPPPTSKRTAHSTCVSEASARGGKPEQDHDKNRRIAPKERFRHCLAFQGSTCHTTRRQKSKLRRSRGRLGEGGEIATDQVGKVGRYVYGLHHGALCRSGGSKEDLRQ